MNGMLTNSKGSTVNRNEWESILGRLDAIMDEINRATGGPQEWNQNCSTPIR